MRMRDRYRLYRRHQGMYYLFDNETGKRESLQTKNVKEAEALLHTKNEATTTPALSFQKARIYLMESDPKIATRTWREVMAEITRTKTGETKDRYERAFEDNAFESIKDRPLIQTHPEHLLDVLEAGTVATNVFLRRIHNFALELDWIPKAILPKRQWPAVRYREKRAVTLHEHQKILERERNPEHKAFYQLCWHLGGSQSDVASLHAEDIDWTDRTLSYRRRKTDSPALIHFGENVAAVLFSLPKSGHLFPTLENMHEKHRDKYFKLRCRTVGITGVTLHSYRYAWAERARTSGMPERFAQEALGHNSAAVHRAYAKKAQVKVPSLEDYERKIIRLLEAKAP